VFFDVAVSERPQLVLTTQMPPDRMFSRRNPSLEVLRLLQLIGSDTCSWRSEGSIYAADRLQAVHTWRSFRISSECIDEMHARVSSAADVTTDMRSVRRSLRKVGRACS